MTNHIVAFILGAYLVDIIYRYRKYRLERAAQEVEDEIMRVFEELGDGFWVATADGDLYGMDAVMYDDELDDIWIDALDDIEDGD